MTKAIDKHNRTEIESFEPTAKMVEYLETAVELATDSPAKVVRECSVGRTTWYDWINNNPGFEDWFYSEYRRHRRKIIPKLDELTMKYARKGSYQHLELMTKKVGDYPQEIQNQQNTQIVINVPEAIAKKYGATSSTE